MLFRFCRNPTAIECLPAKNEQEKNVSCDLKESFCADSICCKIYWIYLFIQIITYKLYNSCLINSHVHMSIKWLLQWQTFLAHNINIFGCILLFKGIVSCDCEKIIRKFVEIRNQEYWHRITAIIKCFSIINCIHDSSVNH